MPRLLENSPERGASTSQYVSQRGGFLEHHPKPHSWVGICLSPSASALNWRYSVAAYCRNVNTSPMSLREGRLMPVASVYASRFAKRPA